MSSPIDSPKGAVDLSQLLSLFYTQAGERELGRFQELGSQQVPEPYRKLLDHHSHMTVAVESYFGSSVDVRVVQSAKDDVWYSREILLTTQSDGLVVQYGIVRLRYGVLAENVWQEIESGLKPLGRVLIDHDVLRQVELVGLWSVKCGSTLARLFATVPGTITFGRTARIFCDSEPAIELLEIIRPER
jgi:chorismate-pyruvate lyase